MKYLNSLIIDGTIKGIPSYKQHEKQKEFTLYTYREVKLKDGRIDIRESGFKVKVIYPNALKQFNNLDTGHPVRVVGRIETTPAGNVYIYAEWIGNLTDQRKPE